MMVRTSNALALLKVLITAAWADSKLSQSELNYIKELARHFGLNDDDWFELQPYIEDPVSNDEREAVLRDLLARVSTASERNAIIGHLEQIIRADDTISDDEKELLRRYEEILLEPSSLDLMMGSIKALFGKPRRESTIDVDEFLRNKILFKLRRRIGSDQITPDMHRMALLGGLMGIVAHADHDIDGRTRGDPASAITHGRLRRRCDGSSHDDHRRRIRAWVGPVSFDHRVHGRRRSRSPNRIAGLAFWGRRRGRRAETSRIEELRSISSSLGLSHKQYISAKIRKKP